MMKCSIACSILVIFNGLLFLAGLVPLVFAIIALANEELLGRIFALIPGTENISEIISLTDLIKSGAVYFIIIGAIIVIIGFLGCCGACCNVPWMQYVYITLLVEIVLAEVAVIIVATVFPSTFNSAAEGLMRSSLKDFSHDCTMNNATAMSCPSDAITLAWNSMQYELGCCGAKDHTDYNDTSFWSPPRAAGALAPLTCCKSSLSDRKYTNPLEFTKGMDEECVAKGQVVANYYNTGCFTALLHWMVTTPAVIGVMAAILAIEVILFIVAVVHIRQTEAKK